MVHFGEFLKTWSLRSNSVTRPVTFNKTKIGGKCHNSNATFLSNFQTMCKHNIFEIFRVFHFSKKVVDKFIRAVLLCGCGGWTNSWTWWGDFFFKGGNPPSVHLECSLNNCNILTSRHKWKKQCETKNQSSKKLYCQHCFRPHSSKIFKFFHIPHLHMYTRD